MPMKEIAFILNDELGINVKKSFPFFILISD